MVELTIVIVLSLKSEIIKLFCLHIDYRRKYNYYVEHVVNT